MLKKTETSDIIFESGEDLYSQTKGQLLLLPTSTIKLQIAKPRRFQSYCFEFCGITGLSYKTLRFLSLGRDMSSDLIINTSCLVKVNYYINILIAILLYICTLYKGEKIFL